MVIKNPPRYLAAFGVALALSGCATMNSHDELTGQVQSAQKTGGIPAALQALEASATTADQKSALLYNLERGELLRLNRNYKESTDAFLLADIKIKEWEDTAVW